MLKFTSILFLILWSSALKSQNNIASSTEVTSENLRKTLIKNSVKTKTQAENQIVTTTKSNYNNWERQILDAMVVTEIPKEFPLFTTDLTDEQYKANIISWANKNPQYFK